MKYGQVCYASDTACGFKKIFPGLVPKRMAKWWHKKVKANVHPKMGKHPEGKLPVTLEESPKIVVMQ